MQRFLVTGATGQVGAPLVRTLLEAGHTVRAAVRSPTVSDGDRLEPVRFDFTDPATFPAAFTDVDTMFLVRPPALARPRRDLIPALQWGRVHGLRRVVFLSVQGADRLRVVPHARIEEWLRGSGLDWTFLRASFFDQNLVSVHGAAVREHDLLLMPAGEGRTAFVDAHDVAAVAAVAMTEPERHRGRAWTLTGAEALTYSEVAELMTWVLGRTIRYPRPGLLSYVWQASRVLGLTPSLVATTSVVYTTARLGLAAGLTDQVATILGRPPTSMTEFLQRERSAFERPAGRPHRPTPPLEFTT